MDIRHVRDVIKIWDVFKSIKAGLCKVTRTGGMTKNEMNAHIMKMLEQAIEQDGVYNIFAQIG